jgi:hypothetical protein
MNKCLFLQLRLNKRIYVFYKDAFHKLQKGFIYLFSFIDGNLKLRYIVKLQTNFYNKTNKMHTISKLFYFGTTLYMFRTVFRSIMRSLRLYIQHHTVQVLWLLARKQPQYLYDIYLMLYVQS